MIWLPPKRHVVLPRNLRSQRGFIALPGAASQGVPRRPNTDTDPHFASVVSLLHFGGADASTTFTDQKSITWTANGNAQIDTAQTLFGGSSGLFDGTGDYLLTADNAVWTLGTSDFTVEVAARFNGTGNYVIASHYTAGGNQRGWHLNPNVGSSLFALNYSADGVNVTSASFSFSFSTGVWYRLAASRKGSTLTLFVDGARIGGHNIGAASIFNSTSQICIGGYNPSGSFSNANNFNGWLDEWRFTVGVGRYATGYGVSPKAFPDS
jgi:hypothetical protein